MNKTTAKKLLLFILSVLIVSCASYTDSDPIIDTGIYEMIQIDYMSADHIYLSEIIPFPLLPNGESYISNTFLAFNKIYFTARNNAEDGTCYIFSMEIDSTGFKRLPDHVPGSIPSEIYNGNVFIENLFIDNENNIWIIENRQIEEMDLPDDLGVYILRKLDKNGREISKFSLNDLRTDHGWLYTQALHTDITGNIYISSLSKIYILDKFGKLSATLDITNNLNDFVLLSDGRVALVELDWSHERRIYMKPIEPDTGSWGQIIVFPQDIPWIHSVFPGFGEFLCFYNDKIHLYGINVETDEHKIIFNWNETGLSSEEINSIMFMPDGNIAITRLPSSAGRDSSLTELVLLTRTSRVDVPDKKILSLATFNSSNELRYVVEQFNRNNTTHSINVINYNQEGLLKLSAEMIAGNSPDILDIMRLPMHSYIAKGLLVDLYPFLDADNELSRESLVESMLKTSEVNGSLYRLIPSFELTTIFGHPSILGEYPGWTADEFLDVINSNPNADRPVGNHGTKTGFLSFLIRNNIDEYIDWSSGTVYFENDDFIKMLETANTYPDHLDTGISINHAVAEGRQIMQIDRFGILDFQIYRSLFGGELVLKGFPAANRDGNVFRPLTNLAITKDCDDPEAAWEFLRLFLLEDIQRNINPAWMFPMNKVVFDEVLNTKIEGVVGIGSFILKEDEMNLTLNEIDYLKDIINNTTRIRNDDDTIWDIISETASDFFNGRHTAQDAARIIQSRAAIYLSELN